MKKVFITLGVVVVLFVMCVVFGCEKPALSGENKSEGAKRTLRVNVFQIENTPFEDLTRGAVGDVCTRLNFVVYDMTRISEAVRSSWRRAVISWLSLDTAVVAIPR